jgi:hypothetical protein
MICICGRARNSIPRCIIGKGLNLMTICRTGGCGIVGIMRDVISSLRKKRTILGDKGKFIGLKLLSQKRFS